MSLDQNLFTLHVTPDKDHPQIVDLIDSSGTIHYRKHRLPGAEYKAEVYDPISQSLLITATSPTATSKTKVLELYNPTILVELRYTGTLSFRWSFQWEEHTFEWKREECYMLRKPDPPVLVAVTKEPAGRLKTATVQILDYNLNRFDITDRKGLEIVILTALMTFSDVNDGYHAPQETAMRTAGRTTPAVPPAPAPAVAKHTHTHTHTHPAEEARPPPMPPKPAPKTGVDRIAEMQASLGEYNEIFVEEEGQVHHYAEYCSRLLEDDAMLFVTVRSAAAEQVPKVLQVVQETKRIRYKAGLSEEAELHQYVVYDKVVKIKGPRRINLDDVKSTNVYTPPTSLTVHLSKIDMPELQPKATPGERPSGGWVSRDTSKENTSAGTDSKGKDSTKKDEKKASGRTAAPLDPAKLTKRSPSPSPPARGHVPPRDHLHTHGSPSPPEMNTPPAEPAPSKHSDAIIAFPTPTIPGLGALSTSAQFIHGVPGASECGYTPPPPLPPRSHPHRPSSPPAAHKPPPTPNSFWRR